MKNQPLLVKVPVHPLRNHVSITAIERERVSLTDSDINKIGVHLHLARWRINGDLADLDLGVTRGSRQLVNRSNLPSPLSELIRVLLGQLLSLLTRNIKRALTRPSQDILR